MLISYFALCLLLLPYTICAEPAALLREHCKPLLQNGYCNLECPEEFEEFQSVQPEKPSQPAAGDCVLFPVQTKSANLTMTFDAPPKREDAFSLEPMIGISMEATITSFRFVNHNQVRVLMNVRSSVSDAELYAVISELEAEILSLGIGNVVNSTIRSDPIPASVPDHSPLAFVIGALILGILFGTVIVGGVSSDRTRESRSMKPTLVWYPPKGIQENPEQAKHMMIAPPHHYNTAMPYYGQHRQSYEHYLNCSTSHQNYGFLPSPSQLIQPIQEAALHPQQPTVLYTQACQGNISLAINPSEIAQSVNGIYPIHAVVSRSVKSQEEEKPIIQDIQKLLKAGADINQKTCTRRYWSPERGIKDEETALIIAVTRNLYAVTEFLLENGADQWAFNSSNSTCMHQAVQGSDVRMLKLLVKYHKEDPQKDELIGVRGKIEALNINLLTPLMCCADAPPPYAVEMAKILIEAGAKVDSIEDQKRRNVLHYAAMLNNLELLEYLLSLETIKLETQDDAGATALMLAVQHGYTEIVRRLWEAGACSKTENVNLQNSLQIATESNFVDIVNIFKTSRKRKSSSPRTTLQEGKRTPPMEHRSTLGDVTNTVPIFHTPPSSYENNLTMKHTPMLHAQHTSPDSAEITDYHHYSIYSNQYIGYNGKETAQIFTPVTQTFV